MTENKEPEIVQVTCPECGGNGLKGNTWEYPEVETCYYCEGDGWIWAYAVEPTIALDIKKGDKTNE